MASKKFWGPPIWSSIHILATSVEESNAEYFAEFLWVLTRLIPCDSCRANLIKKLRTNDPEKYFKRNPKSAFYYTYTIHDQVNQHLSKTTNVEKHSPQFEQVSSGYYQKLKKYGPKFWGPPIWSMIHILAASFRPADAAYFERFVFLLQKFIPGKEYKQFINNNSIKPFLLSNDDLFYYTFVLHNYVNEKLNKPIAKYSKVKSFYFSSLGKFCGDCN